MDFLDRFEAKAKELKEKLADAYENREELLEKAKKELSEEIDEFTRDAKHELADAKVKAADLYEKGKSKLDEAYDDFKKKTP